MNASNARTSDSVRSRKDCRADRGALESQAGNHGKDVSHLSWIYLKRAAGRAEGVWGYDDRRYDVVSLPTTDKRQGTGRERKRDLPLPRPRFRDRKNGHSHIRRSRNASYAGKYIITHSQATPSARSPGYKSANTLCPVCDVRYASSRSHSALSSSVRSSLSFRFASFVCPNLFFLYPPRPLPRHSAWNGREGISGTSRVFPARIINYRWVGGRGDSTAAKNWKDPAGKNLQAGRN